MSYDKKKVLSALKKMDVLEVLNLIPEHIWWKDKEGCVLGCNQSQARDLGFNSPEEVIGKTMYDFLPQKEAEELRQNDLMVMQSGAPATIEEYGYMSTKMPLFDEKNNVIGLLGLSINFKDYKDRVDRTYFILDEIIAAMPGHVYWKDRNCILLGCNEQQAIDSGFRSRHEIVGKNLYDLINKKLPENLRHTQAAATDEADKAIMDSGVAKTFEEFAVELDGREVTYLSQKKPLYDHKGEVIGLLGISVDITELKKAKEQAEAASKAKTEFVQNMQHDIRTPSAGLWGVLDVLAKMETDPDKKEALDMAVAASKRLLDLCNDAVEFGDLSGNTRPLRHEPVNVRELAQGVIELNKPAAFAKDLILNFKVEAAVPSTILSDEFRLSRILVNLIGNAVKFTRKGEITLNIDAKVEEDGRHGVLTLEIKDTGIGVASDKIKNIYDKFSRAVLSNTNLYPGTGLGLYIVKTFMDEMDGDIELESYENSGTCFKLNIPFKVRWEDRYKPTEKIDESFRSPLKKQNIAEGKVKFQKAVQTKTPFTHEILIVEDDKTCLFAEKNLLSAFTNKIDSVENVKDALEKLAHKRYDLVICDLGLPDGSGCDIVAQIRAAKESLNHETPFVAMTAHQDEQKLRQAMESGFSAAEKKPLNTETAVELLNIYPVEGIKQDEHEGLEVIDLALGMQRIGASDEDAAIEALEILFNTLREDIPLLQEAEKNNDIEKAREVLHKIRGGLYYSGTPRLEETFKALHDEVKRTPDLRKIDRLFSLAYDEVKLFAEQYQELIQS